HRSHYKLVCEERLPKPGKTITEPFRGAQQSGGAGGERPFERDAGYIHGTNSKAAVAEKLPPAVPGIEAEVGAIEQPLIVLREASQGNLPTEVNISAVGQRGDELPPRPQDAAKFIQQIAGAPQVFEDIGANNVVKLLVHPRQTLVQISLDEFHRRGKIGAIRAGMVDAGNAKTPPGKGSRKVSSAAAGVQHS